MSSRAYNSFLALEAEELAALEALDALLAPSLLALVADLDARLEDLDASTLATEEAELKLALASLDARPNWLSTMS